MEEVPLMGKPTENDHVGSTRQDQMDLDGLWSCGLLYMGPTRTLTPPLLLGRQCSGRGKSTGEPGKVSDVRCGT